jgi:F-type H+-transporting ATPase subunit epsilon
MADNGFRLTVLTEERAVIDETIRSLIAPGTEGYLGVWRNHAPLVTGLMPGRLTVIRDDAPQDYAVAGGFLEIRANVATLLADALEPVAEIDVPRAEAAASRARQRLQSRGSDVDVERAEAALKRALNRLRLASS